MIYLASPYSSPDPAIMVARLREACLFAAEAIRRGHRVFSPIAHSAALVDHGLPSDFSFWEGFDREVLAACSEVWVLMLDGWDLSAGVTAEIAEARRLGKVVSFLNPTDSIEEVERTYEAKMRGARPEGNAPRPAESQKSRTIGWKP